MTVTAGADEKNPTHHVSLSDGINTVGLMLADYQGKDEPKRITRSNYPRMSTQINTGGSKYDNAVPPYKPLVQDNASGGRALDIFEDDTTRFGDNYRTNTLFPKQVILGSAEYYSTDQVFRRQLKFWWGGANVGLTWVGLYGATRYLSAVTGVNTGDFAIANLEVVLRKVGSPGTLTAGIWSDDGIFTVPNLPVATATLTSAAVPDTASFNWLFSIPYTLGNLTTYHIVLQGNAGDNAANHWELMGSTQYPAGGLASADAANWVNGTLMFYRITHTLSSVIAEGREFFYKGGYYFVSKSGIVYLNGDRGAADSNAGQLTKLIDATKAATWATIDFTGAVALIVKGPGSEEVQPWRNIVSNNGTSLTVDNSWLITHTTETEYVILGSDIWTQMIDLGVTGLKSVAASDEQVFCAFGRGKYLQRYYEYNNAGTWTIASAADNLMGIDCLAVTRHPTDGQVLWAGRNDHSKGAVVYKVLIPPVTYGNTYKKRGVLVPKGIIWDDRYLSGVTQTFSENWLKIAIDTTPASGSIVASMRITPLDLNGCSKINFLAQTSIALLAGDLKLVLSDKPLVKSKMPDMVFVGARRLPPDSVYYYDNSAADAAHKYRPLPQAAFDMPGQYQGRNAHATLDTSDALFIGSTTRFDKIHFRIPTVNNNAATMAVNYWDGVAWVAIGGPTDGTAAAGATLGQDGTISFSAPNEWQMGCSVDDVAGALSTSLFWIKLTNSAALDVVSFKAEVEYTAGGTDYTWESHRYVTWSTAKDGDTDSHQRYYCPRTSHYIYVGLDEVFNKITVDLGAEVNTTINATLSAQYFDGAAWTSLTITDGTASAGKTLAQDGDVVFTTPVDWEKVSINAKEYYWVRLKVSADFESAGALELVDFREITVKQDNALYLSLPAFAVASRDTWVELDLTHTTSLLRHPDLSSVEYIGLQYNKAATACNFYLLTDMLYGVQSMFNDDDIIQTGNGSVKVLNLQPYGEERQNCWVFKEDGFGEIQSENDDVYVPVPLDELKAFRSVDNARGTCTNDVYLYATWDGLRTERFYNRTLEDIGPDNDEGLPTNRQGTILQLISMPGSILAGIDAGSTGYSCVLQRKGSGWHELYRFPYGQRFRRMGLQVIPGTAPSRLWMACGDGDMKYILLPKVNKNPYKDTGYRYVNEGSIITPWISAGFLDISKLFSYLSAYTENLSSGHQEIQVDYQLETGSFDSGWTAISEFVTSPWQQLAIGSFTVKGRRFRLRFRLQTDDMTETPVLKSWVLDSMLRFPVKYSYTFTGRLADEDKDARNVADKTKRAETDLAILDAWSTALTVLTFRNPYSTYDNKNVVLEPMGMRPLGLSTKDALESHTIELTVLGI